MRLHRRSMPIHERNISTKRAMASMCVWRCWKRYSPDPGAPDATFTSRSGPRLTKLFIRRSRSRLGSMRRRPQVWHLTPMSAPIRKTDHSNPPHGCDLRIRSTSPARNSSGPSRLGGMVASASNLHQTGNLHSPGERAEFVGAQIGRLGHGILYRGGDQVFQHLDIGRIDCRWIDFDPLEFL